MKKIRRENKLIKELTDQYGVKTHDFGPSHYKIQCS